MALPASTDFGFNDNFQQQQIDSFGFVIPSFSGSTDFGFNASINTTGFSQQASGGGQQQSSSGGISLSDIPIKTLAQAADAAGFSAFGTQAAAPVETFTAAGDVLSGTVSSTTVGAPIGADTLGGTSFLGTAGTALSGAGIGSLVGKITGGKPIGSAIGGAIGSLIPGLGTIVGGILGGAIGGLFGAGPKAQISEFAGQIGAGGKFTASFGSKGLDTQFGEGLSQQFNSFADSVSATLGIDLEGSRIRGGFNSNEGSDIRTDTRGGGDKESKFSIDPNDQASIQSAFAEVTIELIKDKQNGEITDEQMAQIRELAKVPEKPTQDSVIDDLTKRQIRSGIRRDKSGQITVTRKGTSMADFVANFRASQRA